MRSESCMLLLSVAWKTSHKSRHARIVRAESCYCFRWLRLYYNNNNIIIIITGYTYAKPAKKNFRQWRFGVVITVWCGSKSFALRRARFLVLGRWPSSDGLIFSVCNQPARPSQPSTLSGTGNEYRRKCGDVLRLGSIKADMAYSTCAGGACKTMWSFVNICHIWRLRDD